MNAIIGLVDRKESLEKARSELEAAGYEPQMIRVLANCEELRAHVACSCQSDVFRDAAIGAGLIGGIYAVFGAAAAWGAILNGVPTAWSVRVALVFLLTGMSIGAFGGAFVGRAEAEKETHLYTEGVQRGAAVLLIWSEKQRTSETIGLLRRCGVLGVMACTRARPLPAIQEGAVAMPA